MQIDGLYDSECLAGKEHRDKDSEPFFGSHQANGKKIENHSLDEIAQTRVKNASRPFGKRDCNDSVPYQCHKENLGISLRTIILRGWLSSHEDQSKDEQDEQEVQTKGAKERDSGGQVQEPAYGEEQVSSEGCFHDHAFSLQMEKRYLPDGSGSI
jgi:hypothetical protein